MGFCSLGENLALFGGNWPCLRIYRCDDLSSTARAASSKAKETSLPPVFNLPGVLVVCCVFKFVRNVGTEIHAACGKDQDYGVGGASLGIYSRDGCLGSGPRCSVVWLWLRIKGGIHEFC